MKKGFTLIELLAVIVILSLIMVIAVPQILSVIEKAKVGAMESDAKLIIDTINKKAATDENYNYLDITEENIEARLGIKPTNYADLVVTRVNGKPRVLIIGQSKWVNLLLQGTYDDLKIENTGDLEDGTPPEIGYFYIGSSNNTYSITSLNTVLYSSVANATEMCINTSPTCDTWIPYSSALTYTLTGTVDSTLTLYAYYRDIALNVVNASDTVKYLQAQHDSTYTSNATGFSYAGSASWDVTNPLQVQGDFSTNLDYYSIYYFGELSSIKSKFTDYSIGKITFKLTNIVDVLTRTTNLYVGGPCPTLTGTPPSSYSIVGSKPTALSTYISSDAVSGYNPAIWSNITNTTWINYLANNSNSACLFTRKSGSTSYWWRAYGAKATNADDKPIMTITWVPRT